MAERIKAALEKARERRQQSRNPVPGELQNRPASGARHGSERLLALEPFRHCSTAGQQRLLERARVFEVSAGETFRFAEDRDAYVHYLLSGTVVLERETGTRTVTAESPAAAQLLDRAGPKTHAVTATLDSEILRVPADALATDNSADCNDEEVVPPTEYTETKSGRRLAELVEAINAEHATLNEPGPGVFDPRILPGGDRTAESFADLAASAGNPLAGPGDSGEEPILPPAPGSYEPKIEDEIGIFTRDLEARFRRYVNKVKADERARYDSRLQEHADRLQSLAEQHINTRVAKLKERYQSAHVEKERRLRARYRALREFANRIARQKAAICAARRQVSEKLRMVEQIHSELAQLGNQLNHQLDELDDLMPGAMDGDAADEP